MAVQIWGAKPEHAAEREALSFLYRTLKPLAETYWLCTNVELPPQADLIVLKREGLFLVEFKYCEGGRVRGTPNGRWTVADAQGRTLRVYNRDVKTNNPYQQLVTQYRALKELLNRTQAEFMERSTSRAITDIKKLLVFVPELPEGSEIEPGDKLEPPRGAVLGLADLPEYLDTRSSQGVSLSEGEIRTLVQSVLGLEPQAVKLSRPLGGEILAGEQEVRWTTLAPWVDVAAVELSLACERGDGRPERLALKRNDGCHPWNTQRVRNGRYRLKLEARDPEGAIVGEDESEAFTVRNARGLVPRRRVLAALPLLAGAGLLLWKPWQPAAGVLTPEQIEADPARYLGRVVTVRFRVVETREAAEVIFLNSSAADYDTDFTVAIFKEDLPAFRRMGVADPLSYYYGRTVEATGKLERFQGPEIVARRPTRIRVSRWWRFWE